MESNKETQDLIYINFAINLTELVNNIRKPCVASATYSTV